MAQKKITLLPSASGITKTDIFPTVNLSADTTQKITFETAAYIINTVGTKIVTSDITPTTGNTVYVKGNLEVTGTTSFNTTVKLSGITSGNSTNEVLTINSFGQVFKSPIGSLTKCFGVFSSNVIQTNFSANTAQSMSASTIEHSSGVTVSGGSKFVVSSGGTYNIQFSAQLDKTDSGEDDISIWFRKNGTNIPRSTTNVTLVGNTTKSVAAWNYIDVLNANDYLEIMWSSADTGMRIFATSGLTSPTRPDVPSVIVTVNQI